MERQFRSLWLSDLHLGDGNCRASELLSFLQQNRADTLYLVGDILDISKLGQRTRLPARHAEVILQLLTCAAAGCRVVYVSGHCDAALSALAGETIAAVEICASARHVTADGRELLVLHGSELDRAVREGTRLERFAATSYRWLVESERRFHELGRCFGGQPSAVAIGVSKRLAKAREYLRRFAAAAPAHARAQGCDGIVCGYSHLPQLGEQDGILYANSGDWIDHCSALAEQEDGKLVLLRQDSGRTSLYTAASATSLAA